MAGPAGPAGAGRALCLLLSIYGFAVFGYITAALASHFINRDQHAGRTGPKGAGTMPAAESAG